MECNPISLFEKKNDTFSILFKHKPLCRSNIKRSYFIDLKGNGKLFSVAGLMNEKRTRY